MRVTSREQIDSRSEFFRRCRLLAISAVSVVAIAACGGGGGGGDSGGAQEPPPTQSPPSNPPSTPPPANAAPTVNAGADHTIEWPTNTVEVSGSATDDSSTSLTYEWSATSGPTGVTFASATSAATTVTFPSAGSYVLTLTVSDGSASGTDTVAVTVNPATYPASDAANDTEDHGWARVAAAADVGMDQALLVQAATYASTSGTVNPADNAGMIVRHGRIVHSWGEIDQRYDMKSTTKSIGGIALGLAIDRGLLAVGDAAQTRLPTIGAIPASNAGTGWLGDITVLQLATHTAGFAKTGAYTLPPPNDANPTLIYQPGTTWFYSDGGLNWLSETLTAVFNQDLSEVLRTDVWSVLGLNSTTGPAGGGSTSDIHWRDNAFRPQGDTIPHNRELASGIFANANAMARVGLLFLRKGMWANDQRVLSEAFVQLVSTPPEANAALSNPDEANFPGATTNYGVLWWTNATGLLPNVPRDAFWAWGLGDSLIVVIPSLDIVAVRAGPQADPLTQETPTERVWNDTDWNGDYAVLAPFLDPIVQSVTP
ncbi:MAG TPA: serine hydrolase [Steroidobacter sp.]|uniref:serine hydrolase domain-containing protein n=1 Tax=Steroidobacter sp. TaxID=1978227 RepID=UPI002EDB926A